MLTYEFRKGTEEYSQDRNNQRKARLTRTYSIGEHTVQVEVVLDPHFAQNSSARANVLTSVMTWTTIAVEDPILWHEDAKRQLLRADSDPYDDLCCVISNLVKRASIVLEGP